MAKAKKISEIGKKLKILRQNRGISREKAAHAAGISYDYLAKIENGQRNPNIARLEAVAKALGTQLADLISAAPMGDLRPSKPFPLREWGLISLGEGIPVPRIGWARAGSWDEASDSGFEPGAADEWLYSDHAGGRVFALRVEGDSMEPEFFEGEFILVDPDREAMAGDYVIAKLDAEGEATFKQLKYRDGVPFLHPLNPNYADIELSSGNPGRNLGTCTCYVSLDFCRNKDTSPESPENPGTRNQGTCTCYVSPDFCDDPSPDLSPQENLENLGTRNEYMSPDSPDFPNFRIVGVVVEKKTIFGVSDAREAKIRAIAGRIEGLDDRDLDRVTAALDLLFP